MNLIERLIHSLPKTISRFAEIGPGLGDTSLFVAQTFPESRGDLFEFSQESVEILKHRTANNSFLSVHSGDFRELDISSESYDLVIACEVFEHLEDDESAFDTVRRMLRPGGYILLSVPAFMRKWQGADEYAGHFRSYERDELMGKFARIGMRIHKMWCYGFPVTQLLSVPYRIYYGRQLRANPLPKAESTKRSGSERTVARKFNRDLVVQMMKPLFLLQSLAKSTNIGDGYLVLAQK